MHPTGGWKVVQNASRKVRQEKRKKKETDSP